MARWLPDRGAPQSPNPWTSKLVYDLRTNLHFTLKTKRMQRADLDECVACFNPKNRHQRKPTWSEKRPDGRWRAYGYDELAARDQCSLDLFWQGVLLCILSDLGCEVAGLDSGLWPFRPGTERFPGVLTLTGVGDAGDPLTSPGLALASDCGMRQARRPRRPKGGRPQAV